ncbi:hypothetical protein MRX96_028037 [Rhipicephalus microplus]
MEPSGLVQVSREIPSISAPRKSVSEAPRSSKVGKEFHDWLLYNIPEFSDSVQPVLQGKAVSERLQKKKTFQAATRRIDLVSGGSVAQCTKPLVKHSPRNTQSCWGDEPEEHLLATRTHVYSLFIKRFSVARKVRNHRKSKRAHVTVLSPTTEITKENAVAELQALKAIHLSAMTLDTERMQALFKVTYEERCKSHDDPLPEYFLLEEILCIEVELRFKSSIGDLERKLRAVSEAFSCKEQHGLPDDVQIAAPHGYTRPKHTCVYAGSAKQVLQAANRNLERALIFRLLTYYIKNLEYPPAFSPFLVLLPQIALPDTPVPRGLLTNSLKNLLLLLRKKNV